MPANIIRLENRSYNDQIATIYPCAYKKQFPFPKMTGQFQHILSTTEGLVFLSQSNHSSVGFVITDGATAINSWLKNQGIKATLSDAGRSTTQIIQTLGGFQGVRALASNGVVVLLDEIARKPLKSMICQMFKEKIKYTYKNKSIISDQSFKTLVERQAVVLGQELRCSECSQWSWYSIKQSDYQLECGFCLQMLEFPITEPENSKMLRYAYRVVGVFALPDYARGGYAAALTIRFFGDIFSKINGSKITWSAGQELQLTSEKKVEADFIVWSQQKRGFDNDSATEIIFGEVKSFGYEAFTQDDIDRMKLLAQIFPGSFFVFATLKEELSLKEISRIKKFAEWGKAYDKERKKARASIIILTGVELFTDFDLMNTWEAKDGIYKELLGDPWVARNRMNLQRLAEITQQLYLGMPSFSEWRKAKNGKFNSHKDILTLQGG